MVLVDTSVWIRTFYGQPPFSAVVAELIRGEQAASHPLIYGEVLMGDRGGRRRFLLEYAQLPRAIFVPHDEVITLVHLRRLQGRGIGWVDAHLLASALADRMQLFTADERLAAIAEELGVAYKL
jgi:predicted nucleic acid-binding protein